MSRSRLIIITIIAVILATGAGTLTARLMKQKESAAPPIEHPDLTVDPRDLDFGEVWETDQFKWAVTVHNATDKPTIASAYSTSCSCIPATSSKTIPPNSSEPLDFQIDLRQQCASAEPQVRRETKIQVTLNSNNESPLNNKLTPITLRGRVKSAIIVPTRSVDFGRFQATADSKLRVLPIRALTGLHDLTATIDEPSAQIELKPTGAGTWDLLIHPFTTTFVGKHTATVSLVPVTLAGEKVPPTKISIAFEVLHDIQPDTIFIPLGDGYCGEVASSVVTISSLSGRPFLQPLCESKDSLIQTKIDKHSESSYAIKISRKITEIGNSTTSITISGNDADGKPFELRVDTQWYGVTK